MHRHPRFLGALALLLAAIGLMRPGGAPHPACNRCTNRSGTACPAPATDSPPGTPSAPATARLPTHLASRCKDCEKCIDACPTGALTRKVVDGKIVYEADPELCDGCGQCVEACRKKALTMKPAKGIAAK